LLEFLKGWTDPYRKVILFRLIAAASIILIFFSSCKEVSSDQLVLASSHTQEVDTIKILEQSSMVLIPGGTLYMGGDNYQAAPNEFPKHSVVIDSFYMDQTEVTNFQFARFVNATGYKTIAERTIDWDELKESIPPGTPRPPDEVMQPGALVFKPTAQPVSLDNPGAWWHWTIGADWRHPTGPESNINGKEFHPVVQVSWVDAVAYASWTGNRLPTEAEWEWAARGGMKGKIYPWGNDDINEGAARANFWQGLFPYQNTRKDGYETTAPVGSFPPNDYGLNDMSGNVWEWCSDWYGLNYYSSSETTNPQGPESGLNSTNPYQPHRVIRGGSFLCNDSYCSGYRNARRMGTSTDTGLSHTGFRCVRDINEQGEVKSN